MKKISVIDTAFLGITLVVVGLGIVEIIQLIAPYYSYGKLLVVFMILTGIYIGYKQIQQGNKLTGGVGKRHQATRLDDVANIDTSSRQASDDYFEKYNTFVHEQRDSLMYLACVILFCFVSVSLLFGFLSILQYALILFFGVYVYAKLLGFRFDFTIKKSKFSQSNTLRFFVIVFALYISCISIFMNELSLESEVRMQYILIFGILYFLMGAGIFFHIPLPKRKYVNVYNSLSFLLILFLGAILVYSNLPEKTTSPTEPLQNPSMLTEVPELIESEPSEELISDEVPLQETRLVSQVYAINPGLSVGSEDGSVTNLKQVLASLEYYDGEINNLFDESLRTSLRSALIGECDWPESTTGIFGPQAKECIDNLEILIPQN